MFAKQKDHWSSTFDKSMIYPGILLILFGSQVINVMNRQKYINELDRVYKIKINKIHEIAERLEHGEKGVNVEDEMKLVNMMFERQMNSTKMKLSKEYEVEHKIEEIYTDLNKELNQEDFIKMLGLNDEPIKKKEIKILHVPGKESVITDHEEIKDQITKQKELTKFVVKPETHIIVEKPGDYIESAKDTKLSKFL